jgi:hypothetical protein
MSNTEEAKVPDCNEIATPPGGKVTGTIAAWIATSGSVEAKPKLAGPMIRKPLRRAVAISSGSSKAL